MYQTSKGEFIAVDEIALGSGGEGNVYEIKSPEIYLNHVAKIYHPRERTKIREEKLKYMIAYPPEISDSLTIIFPVELIYKDGDFVGFIMLKARGEYDLSVLTTLSLSKKLPEEWQKRYQRNEAENIKNYLLICYNLAHTLAEFDRNKNYILVDFKPENIKVNLAGQISIIDLDSIEIVEEGKVLFAADKLSKEYSPPEVKTLNPEP